MKNYIMFWLAYVLSELLIAKMLYIGNVGSDIAFIFGNLFFGFALILYAILCPEDE